MKHCPHKLDPSRLRMLPGHVNAERPPAMTYGSDGPNHQEREKVFTELATLRRRASEGDRDTQRHRQNQIAILEHRYEELNGIISAAYVESALREEQSEAAATLHRRCAAYLRSLGQ